MRRAAYSKPTWIPTYVLRTTHKTLACVRVRTPLLTFHVGCFVLAQVLQDPNHSLVFEGCLSGEEGGVGGAAVVVAGQDAHAVEVVVAVRDDDNHNKVLVGSCQCARVEPSQPFVLPEI